MERLAHDGVLIVGAGLAGLSAALAAAPRKALVLSAAPLNHGCSSAWAQGGMAAALSAGDAPAPAGWPQSEGMGVSVTCGMNFAS